MSDREKGDGLLIGILVLLVILVIGGLGFGTLMFVRVQTQQVQTIMVMEEAHARELEARVAAEQLRQAAETAREKAEPKNAEQSASDEP